MAIVPISLRTYTFHDFTPFLARPVRVRLSREAQQSIRLSHQRFLQVLDREEKIYGVTTGFGKLSQVTISPADQQQLQFNLVRSHAAGVGAPFDPGITRIILFLKLITFAKGASGVRLVVARQVADFLNHDILPLIPRQGSVGASGDLAPLAHLALALIGEGEVLFQERVIPSMLALREVGLQPLTLQPKEGLSLINGTQVSTALAVKALLRAETLLKTADIAGALSVEASLSSQRIFHPAIHRLKQHPGQQLVARNIYRLLDGSEIVASHEDCERVQDPYSIRCIPHVHGASRDGFTYVREIVDREINSVSDNPLILPDGQIATSGHFHGESLAQALDTLAVAMSEIGAVAERRIHFFMKGITDKIPPFLANHPGLESGFMLAQVTAASLASENKTLAHPASVDSIPTSGGHEDFVSMAPWAGRKVLRILNNVARILAIELLVAATATVVYHRGLRPGIGTAPLIALLKKHIDFTPGDHPPHEKIAHLVELINTGKIVQSVQKQVSLE
jgi:histidine ammonia-lyase